MENDNPMQSNNQNGSMSQQSAGNNNYNPNIQQPNIYAPQPPLNTPKKGGAKKVVMIILAVLLALMVISGISLAFVFNNLNNKPEKVLSDAFANIVSDTVNRNPYTYVSKISIKDPSKKLDASLEFNTQWANNNGQVDAKLNLMSEGTGATSIDLKASVLNIDNKEYYLKIDDLKETLDNLSKQYSSYGFEDKLVAYDSLIKKIDGSWIKIYPLDTDTTESLNLDNNANPCVEAANNIKISKADQKTINKIFKDNRFIIVEEVYGKDNVDADKSFHYKINFDNDKGTSFTKELMGLESFKEVVSACEIKEEDFTNNQNYSSQLDNTTTELWVNAKSRRFNKITTNYKNKTLTMDFASTINFDNKNIQVQKPSSFITIDEIKSDAEAISKSQEPDYTDYSY